ncbi:MAG: hypothetical protein A2Z18_10975 [Armatimonadetes bacterium RBG_16_58_9]|nr:MAG: hypothetical protein A2Z18_10975 [Armatimonadetes bacterium RBG_16_58_9]
MLLAQNLSCKILIEGARVHSRAKLALAVFTSSVAAYHEILERKLLGTGLAIAAMTGTVASVPLLIYGFQGSPIQFLALGKQNPLSWLGLCMLYALVLQRLLKWIGTEIEFASLLTILGWSQLALLVSHLITAVAAATVSPANANQTVVSFISAATIALPAWYVTLVGMGIRTSTGVPLSRGVMTYVMVALSAQMAFTITYASSLARQFENALPGVRATAQAVVSVDQTPWLAAAVIGLVLGIWQIGKYLGWDKQATVRAAASAGLVGVVAFGFYAHAVWIRTDYYRKLADANKPYLKAQRLYDNNKADWLRDKEERDSSAGLYRQAAEQTEALLSISKDNLMLALDIGDLYYLAGEGKQAIKSYNRYVKVVDNSPNEAQRNATLARIYTGIGAVYDIEGKYDHAVRQFKKAVKAEPKFRDAWVRLAVTYDRMGEYRKAVDAADRHAIRQLNSEAALAWFALAQAFVETGDKKQAGTAITMLTDKDGDLAKRIGDKANDWKDAVEKLTREDLKFPLEEEPLQTPEFSSRKVRVQES